MSIEHGQHGMITMSKEGEFTKSATEIQLIDLDVQSRQEVTGWWCEKKQILP